MIAMMFCPKCGSLMVPRKRDDKTVLACSCGYVDKKEENLQVKEIIKEARKVESVDKEVEVYPLANDQECPKCSHKFAYFWEVQTRASDEPATKFYKCEKCRHIWRDYK